MAEPASSSAAAGAAGIAGWKAIGGLVGVAAGGASLAAIVVMLMTPPRSAKEWAVGLICTVLGSVTGGAAVVVYFNLVQPLLVLEGGALYMALVALLGLVFACGLPAWALVRWAFTWMERRRDRDLAEVVAELRRDIAGGQAPAPTEGKRP